MKTYTIQVQCSNCDHIGPTEIQRGTPVPDQLECPNCSCKTAKKYKGVSSLPIIREKESTWPWPPRIWTEPERTWIGESEPVYPFKVTCERKAGSTPCSG